jgi:hypothetical protein
MSLKFKKKKEDFVCENPDAGGSGGRLERRPCNTLVKGDGFTNHCSKCLYSKHVDIFPVDRSETCGGLMKPISAEENGGEWSVIHKCLECSKIQKNKISKEYNFEEVIKISAKN